MTDLGESGSKVSHFISELRNFSEVTRLPEDVKFCWLKATLKEIKNIINNKTFIIDNSKKGYPVAPFMYVYRAKIQSDGSLEKLKLRIVVRGKFNNKEIIGDTCYTTSSMRTLKFF